MRFVLMNIVRPEYRAMKGIYKIVIGGKFYIGRAENLYRRICQHEDSINNALLSWRFTPHRFTQYIDIAKYIEENRGILYCNVYLIQRCISNVDLVRAEQYYLSEYYGHPDCFNKSRNAGGYKGFREGKNPKWDVMRTGSFTGYCFDPENPENKIDLWAPLTKNGKFSPKKQKEITQSAKDFLEREKAKQSE